MLEKEEPQEEYIITSSDVYNAHNLYSENGYADRIGEFYKSLERIVRCRDCKWYLKYESMWDTDEWCTRCEDDDTGVFEVDSDGFCKWGKPKVVE